jgi:hypothetical protein
MTACLDAGSSLTSLQLRVGVPGRGQCVDHALRSGLTCCPGTVTLQLDFHNSCNSVSQQALLQAVAMQSPRLLPSGAPLALGALQTPFALVPRQTSSFVFFSGSWWVTIPGCFACYRGTPDSWVSGCCLEKREAARLPPVLLCSSRCVPIGEVVHQLSTLAMSLLKSMANAAVQASGPVLFSPAFISGALQKISCPLLRQRLSVSLGFERATATFVWALPRWLSRPMTETAWCCLVWVIVPVPG